jgi:Family of unknown function (DUF6064)
MWAWTGIAYHWLFFLPINKAALVLGGLFVVQGALLMYFTVMRGRLEFGESTGLTAWLGWALVIYATCIYPPRRGVGGHRYPEMPMFGITPCPVTIFTFGVLLLATAPVPRWLFVIPILWSLVGGSAAFLLAVPQDWMLLISGIAVAPVLLLQRRRVRTTVPA